MSWWQPKLPSPAGEESLFALWAEVVGCIVLGAHPHWEITIQPTVFPKVLSTRRSPHRPLHVGPLSQPVVLLMQCEVVDCIVRGSSFVSLLRR